jgi:hypothetical protein
VDPFETKNAPPFGAALTGRYLRASSRKSSKSGYFPMGKIIPLQQNYSRFMERLHQSCVQDSGIISNRSHQMLEDV